MANDLGAARPEHFDKNWQNKQRMVEVIDSLREPAGSGCPVEPVIVVDDGVQLREKLHTYEQTCALLEREVQILEQQTLAALAEAGRLRRELDKSEEEKRRTIEFVAVAGGRAALERRVADSENEKRMLLDALENSEAELARMVKTLDIVVRKLQVA